MLLEKSKELVRDADRASEELQSYSGKVRVVAHYDCDGISSAVIAHELLDRSGIPFDISFVDELNREVLEEIVEESDEDLWLFVDIGSGQIEDLEELLEDEKVFIADHHEPSEGSVDHHLNPHLHGIDGGENISGAGVTYLLARTMAEDNQDLLQYALVGATGDIQKEDGKYLGLNESMMENAVDKGLVERKKGLKLYGRTRKSIIEAFKYTTDPYLPGITNNEPGAVQFLSEIGIDLRENGGWRSLDDLSPEEEREIVHGLITKGYDVEQLLGDIYMLDNGWEIREFSSLLNACGRMERPEDGIRICLENDFDLAENIKRDYGRKIGSYLSFLEDNLGDSDVVQEFGNGAAIVAEDNIHSNMIGTITTIAQKSDILPRDVLVGLAWKDEEHTKISARAKDEVVENGLKMNELMEELSERFDGEGGGHEAAAGGKIPREKEGEFVQAFIETVEERR
ncbi:MAG: DHH family phosphoesterase [Candidatus Nanohaloarchaeota archaeon QJJ-7]|nr:DHH family phosphoesterase [Candidatus Nanohaloarchaeota archaeon QJJ-7]